MTQRYVPLRRCSQQHVPQRRSGRVPEAMVGAIAMPVLYLVAIGKVRTDVSDRGELREEGQRGDDDD